MPERVLVPLEEGFEELELVAPVDVLRRAGIDCVIAGVHQPEATGRNGLRLRADRQLADLHPDDFTALFLPGGPAVQSLLGHSGLLSMIRAFAESGRLVAAICAAPLLLDRAGVLAGKSFCCHSSVEKELPGALQDPVVWDAPLLTSRGAGTALPFGLAMVARLADEAKAAEVARAICLPFSDCVA